VTVKRRTLKKRVARNTASVRKVQLRLLGSHHLHGWRAEVDPDSPYVLQLGIRKRYPFVGLPGNWMQRLGFAPKPPFSINDIRVGTEAQFIEGASHAGA
jgi:hypothetical protein